MLEATRSLNADLLVAGGYGHSRMREVMLGGTTWTLMHHAGMPLLLSQRMAEKRHAHRDCAA
nr:universal stress protein [Cupriavidus necator]